MSNEESKSAVVQLKKIFDLLGPLIGLVLIITIFAIREPNTFFTVDNLVNVPKQVLVIAVAAIGMTFIIVSGGIDLSVGSAIALTSVIGTMALEWSGSLTVGVLVATLTGILCGIFNGLLITQLRLPPFIVTLGTLEIFRGLALESTGGLPVTNLPDNFNDLADASFTLPGTEFQIPYSLIFLILFAVAAWLVLRKTVFGVSVYAIGSNEQTAKLCGIRVNWNKIAVYGIGGMTAGIAGILQASRLITGQPTTAVGLELDIIAAVVIGGGSLLGGEGTIVGSLIGVAIMGYLRNGCTIAGISPYVQRIVIGSIIILAVFIDLLRHRSFGKRRPGN